MKMIVIGGGAAGFFGAIAAALNHPHAQVTILEAGSKPLSKVRISGGGRCNVTHHCFDPAQLVQNYPRGGKALRGALTRFQPRDTVAWFAQRGVKLKTEADGRMFPVTDSSATIVNCLLGAAQEAGITLRTRAKVIFVKKTAQGFEVELNTGEVFHCDRLLLATGSQPLGYQWAQQLGHTIKPPVPSLFTFTIDDPRLKDLAGVSLDPVLLRLQVDKTKLEQKGAILITHWGLSGPAVLKLSAWGARLLQEHRYQLPLWINWLPHEMPETLRQTLLSAKAEFPKRKVVNYPLFNLPKRLWQQLIQFVGISAEMSWAELSKKALNGLIQELNRGEYQIKAKGVFKEEFVTCGGVTLKEVDFKTMESKCCSGLYFAGEILDIDGVTGGFNFQSAWTTGWIAGQSNWV